MIPTGFHNLTRRETEADCSARRRVTATIGLFGGPASTHGQRLDFGAKAALAAPSSGMGVSFADAYAPSWKAEQAQKDANAARADKLLPVVRQLAQTHGLDLEALEVINIVHRNAKIMGGEAQVWASDAGRAVGISPQKAEAILADAVRRGLLEERSASRFRSKI